MADQGAPVQLPGMPHRKIRCIECDAWYDSVRAFVAHLRRVGIKGSECDRVRRRIA